MLRMFTKTTIPFSLDKKGDIVVTHRERMGLMLLPIENGLIKIYIYGFGQAGAWGQVFVQFDDLTVNIKGYHQKRTIIRALRKLNEMLLDQKNF